MMIELWDENTISELTAQYNRAKNRLILLDFDGTLVELQRDPERAIPSKELSELLEAIAARNNTKLFIITGRNKDDIGKRLGQTHIGIIAEHGATIRNRHGWEKLLGGEVDWKKDALAVFRNSVSDCPNSHIEEKDHSLAWHYRKVDTEVAKFFSGKLIESLQTVINRHDLKIVIGKTTIELISKRINKGLAASYLIQKFSPDFILSMGDDNTDEDVFEALLKNNMAFTVKIGMGNSFARYNLKNVQEANQLLARLV
jgi:trehalose 6-phosphate synthase/phosphatase